MNRLNIGHTLGGRIVGIHVVRRNGNVEYRWLAPEEQPHNMIVQSGVKQMLCYNGTSSLQAGDYYTNGLTHCCFFFESWGCNNRGIFYKMGIGTGTSATTSDMTDLESPIFDAATPTLKHYSSPFLNGGKLFTGSFYDDFGKFRHRYTHYSVSPAETCVVSEFALFGMAGSTDVMFCRVLIPQGLRPRLNPGDRVMFTYELCWDHSPRTVVDLGDLGLYDSIGNPLGICAENKFVPVFDNVNSYPTDSDFMAINVESGKDTIGSVVGTGAASGGYEYPVWKINKGANYSCPAGQWSQRCSIALAWNASHDFPTTYGTSSFSGATSFGESGNYSGMKKISSYIEGTNYRDYSILLQNLSTSDYNMWYLRHHGQDYKFYKMVDGVKTYSPIVIPANKNLELNFRYTINVTAGGVR